VSEIENHWLKRLADALVDPAVSHIVFEKTSSEMIVMRTYTADPCAAARKRALNEARSAARDTAKTIEQPRPSQWGKGFIAACDEIDCAIRNLAERGEG